MDIKEFAESLTDWHRKKIDYLKGLDQKLGEGAELKLQGESVEFSDRDKAMFRLGFTTVLSEFSALPFKIETHNDALEQ